MIKDIFLGIIMSVFFIISTVVLLAYLEGYPNTQVFLLGDLFLLISIITLTTEYKYIERRR